MNYQSKRPGRPSMTEEEAWTSLRLRFAKNYDVDVTTGCWTWTGAVNKQRRGYGQIYFQGRPHFAHRISHMLHIGPIPDDKPIVCHRCDNVVCVNPGHLFAGTNQDNMDDMYAKGRNNQARGNEHGLAKLTEHDVRAIRVDLRSAKKVAIDYGVGPSAITAIRSGKTWNWLI